MSCSITGLHITWKHIWTAMCSYLNHQMPPIKMYHHDTISVLYITSLTFFHPLMDVSVSCPHLHTRFYRRLAGSECLSYWHTDHWSAKPSVWAWKQHAASAKQEESTLNLKAREWKSRGEVAFQRARKTERATAGQMCSTNKNKLAWSARHEHSGGVFTAVWEGCESDSPCTLHIA